MVKPPGQRAFAVRWSVYKMPSVYSQKMNRLGCKIFGEYYYPPQPVEIAMCNDIERTNQWKKVHHRNESLVKRLAELPNDLNRHMRVDYYCPHPQIRELMYTLRMHGLYRSVFLYFDPDFPHDHFLNRNTVTSIWISWKK